MRIDDAGAGDLIGETIAQANGMDPRRIVTWTGTTGPDNQMNGIYFTMTDGFHIVEYNILVPMTSKQYWAYVKEAGIED